MGLEKSNNAVFLSVSDGKITKRVKEPNENSETRVTKEGKTIHEEVYKSISGRITDIKVTSHPQYGKFWNIHIEDDGVNYILQMNYSGGYASSFLKALPNADLSRVVRLSPYVKTVNDKKKVSLYINQDGQTVEWFFTKDDSNGMPSMVQVKRKGILEWDDTDMMEFLEKYVEEHIKPKLNHQAKVDGGVGIGIEEEQDDLPF